MSETILTLSLLHSERPKLLGPFWVQKAVRFHFITISVIFYFSELTVCQSMTPLMQFPPSWNLSSELLGGCYRRSDLWTLTPQTVRMVQSNRILSLDSVWDNYQVGLKKEWVAYTVKPVYNGHSKIDKTKILMKNGSLMKVESIAECSPWSILQYF